MALQVKSTINSDLSDLLYQLKDYFALKSNSEVFRLCLVMAAESLDHHEMAIQIVARTSPNIITA